MYVYLSYLCSLCSWCVSVLFLALVVCVPLLCVCLSFFFLYWFLSFPCFLVSSLFLTVVGFLIRRACSCVLVFVSVVGGVRICLLYVLLSLVSAFFVCCSFFSSCACSCSFAGGRVWFYWRMCVPYVYASYASCISLLSVFLCPVGFCSPGCLCVLGFCVFGVFFGVLGGCLWGVFFVLWRVSGVLFCWGGGFWVDFLFGRCGSIVCFVFLCVVWVAGVFGVLFFL